ncbi:5-methyltetrahydropteroyltriglutamate--homocysteine methyltransferase [Massilia sp. BSC265]|uniref:5-methyltetrahydropteroyltriglutamate-- homocysteine methyltransferase n=1 Tax=Massilia sp. BSC265 TaxID=1549812 RepID=UPI0004E8EE0B|nr:5-methyltetrahydropteroyltriglutamate--homocysteine methyltransferase [Massilia sp. BSC265]KFI05634.1 5-methyltetrahydropteroyltriglutamate--homocysteine methyltransferase [Massilia sp. BSC265]
MIPTEPIGSIPRPPELVAAIRGGAPDRELAPLFDAAVRATVADFEATGALVISDGEQGKIENFWCYPVHGAANTAPDGFCIPLGHSPGGVTHRMPRLTHGPFRYQRYADQYLRAARRYTAHPHTSVKQAIISPSALSLLYPPDGVEGYPREQFLDDLVREHETEIRRCLEAGAHKVQIDFAEGPLAMRLDPSGALLASFVHLNNMALARFSTAERALIGVHVSAAGIRRPGSCAPGAAAAEGQVDYAELLPALFEIRAGSFYIAMAGQPDPERVLRIARDYARPEQRVFVGVTDPLDARIETAQQVRDRVLLAAQYLDPHRLGTTDDAGFAPFFDNDSISRATAFAKVRARVEGTCLAAALLEGAA